jgi:ribonuclease Z
VLVDCGEGTQRQLLRSGAGFRRLERLLLTHRHLDHVLGLGGLISTLALLDASPGMTIHGGPATLRFVETYLAAVWEGRRPPLPLSLAPLAAGAEIAEDGFRITAFPVAHGTTESFGFRFETPPRLALSAALLDTLGVPDGPLRGRVARGEAIEIDGRRIAPEEVGEKRAGVALAVLGDVGDTEGLERWAQGADALVVEASFLERDRALARERDHLTATDAASLAARAGVGRLYLTHISRRYSVAEIEAEARAVFAAARVVADFDRIAVP